MYLAAFAAFLWGLVATFLLIPIATKQAHRIGLLDRPAGRKQHDGDVPIVGGIAIFGALVSGIILTIVLTPQTVTQPIAVFTLLAVAMFVFGVADDYQGLPTVVRFCLQVVVATAMVFAAGVSIETVGSLFPGKQSEITGFASLLFTIMCTVGVINAINMIDGVDGLSGFILLTSFVTLSALAFLSNDMFALVTTTLIAGALVSFLYFNSRVAQPRAKIFLGDAGSTALGFVLVWFFIQFSQGDGAVLSPVSAGWIFGVPLADTISVIVSRIVAGHSPFSPGRDHMHHYLLDNGFSAAKTVNVMTAIQCVFIAVGLTFNQFESSQPLLFWGFTLIVLFHYFFSKRVIRWSRKSTTLAT